MSSQTEFGVKQLTRGSSPRRGPSRSRLHGEFCSHTTQSVKRTRSELCPGNRVRYRPEQFGSSIVANCSAPKTNRVRASDSTHFGSLDQNIFTGWHARYGGRGVLRGSILFYGKGGDIALRTDVMTVVVEDVLDHQRVDRFRVFRRSCCPRLPARDASSSRRATKRACVSQAAAAITDAG